MSVDRLSARVRELATSAPDGPPLRVNVSLTPDASAETHRTAVSQIERLCGRPVTFRPALAIATAVVDRPLLAQLADIDAVEHVEIDGMASPAELID